MKKQLLYLLLLFVTLGWQQAQGQTFGFNGLDYNITSPTTVAVGSNPSASGAIIIPATVINAATSTSYSVTSIGAFAFDFNSLLTSATIPSSVTRIEQRAFRFCTGLTSLTIPNSVTIIDGEAFRNSGLTSIIIPNAVSTIGIAAFYRCANLTSVIIPSSATIVDQYAFSDCPVLTSVTVNWATPLAINANVFSFVPLATATLNVPAGKAAIYDAAMVWTNFNSIVEQVATTVIPTFTAVAPVCAGAIIAALPTTSINSITGTWSPAINNTATTTYTFTPTAGQNATTATVVITVNPIPTAPTAATSITYNQNAVPTALTATGSDLLWYTVPTSGSGATSAPTPSTAILGSTSYWVSQTTNSCESARLEIVVNIIATTPATHLNFDGSNDFITLPVNIGGWWFDRQRVVILGDVIMPNRLLLLKRF